MSEFKSIETYHFSLLKTLADTLATRFHCPLYLVGSFLEKGMDALDIDIIMVTDENRYMRIFKGKDWTERHSRFILKQRKFFEDCLVDVDIDFKVQTVEQFKGCLGTRMKLDSVIPEFR